MIPSHITLRDKSGGHLSLNVEQHCLKTHDQHSVTFMSLKGVLFEGSDANAISERLARVIGHIVEQSDSQGYLVDVSQLRYTWGNSLCYALNTLLNAGAVILGVPGETLRAITSLVEQKAQVITSWTEAERQLDLPYQCPLPEPIGRLMAQA